MARNLTAIGSELHSKAMEKKSKLIYNMFASELLTVPKSKRDALVQEAAIDAIKSSIVHGDVTVAGRLVELFAALVRRNESKQQLIDYLTTWGNFRQLEKDRLGDLRRFSQEDWTADYAAKVSAHRWNDLEHPTTEVKKVTVDAEVEVRKLLRRLEKLSEDPSNEVKNMILVSKIRAPLFDLGSESLAEGHSTPSRVLFDESIARKTLHASKYAKGS